MDKMNLKDFTSTLTDPIFEDKKKKLTTNMALFFTSLEDSINKNSLIDQRELQLKFYGLNSQIEHFAKYVGIKMTHQYLNASHKISTNSDIHLDNQTDLIFRIKNLNECVFNRFDQSPEAVTNDFFIISSELNNLHNKLNKLAVYSGLLTKNKKSA